MMKKRKELDFVAYWANYVRTHPDKEWSRQQNILINSQIQSAQQFPWTREMYFKMKGEKHFK